MNLTIVAGARPNFMKIAPIIKAIHSARQEGANMNYRLVHTGQHYDRKMSAAFFEELGIPEPDNNLECGGGTQAEQTASIMVRFEKELETHRPDAVLVVGDVTSTMACTITAKKLHIDTAHVEAGIRSGDMTMPEEINRIVTDAICDIYFTTSRFANEHLLLQQVDKKRIHFVGNTMIDTLYQNMERLRKPFVWEAEGLEKNNFFLLTLHRPSNVDDPQKLSAILEAIIESAMGIPVVFPVHPRTQKIIDSFGIDTSRLTIIPPQPYLEFIFLVKHTKGIITDSGGITEEATVLNIPCITMRNSTERPETIIEGTNELAGDDYNTLKQYIKRIIEGKWKSGSIPAYWDGHSSERIVQVLRTSYQR